VSAAPRFRLAAPRASAPGLAAIGLAAIGLAAIGLAAIGAAGCRDDGDRGAGSVRERGPGEAGAGVDRDGADRRAHERAGRMLREAGSCAARALPAACLAACELGHSNSCHAAGALRAAAGDPAGALALYGRACDGGSGLGCEAAGRARRAGLGAPADPAAAERLDRRARFYLRVHCEQRHAPSCLALGRLYTTPRGGPADRGSSSTFLARACSLGLAEACAAPAPPAPAPF
jgi:TPR repeat protein